MGERPETAAWVGKQEWAEDVVSQSSLGRFSATFDGGLDVRPGPLACWLFFLPHAAQSDLAADGHPHRGGFLPPIDLPRRMWASGSLRFHASLEVGARITRRSTISAVEEKTGRSGRLAFVTVDHEIRGADGPLVSERQTIVYRDLPAANGGEANRGAPAARTDSVDEAPDWSATVVPDSSLLMRYSALTFNSHKIHYDRRYATEVEGYPGLVVHGPLIATLLLNRYLAFTPGAHVTGFDFRAIAPIYDIAPLTLEGALTAGGANLWALDAAGTVGMKASVQVR